MIGDTIRRIRLEQGITLRQLADMTGVSDSYISLLERNVEEPSIPVLRKLSQVLSRPIAAFFEEDFPEPIITAVGKRNIRSMGDGAASWENLTGIPSDLASVTMLRFTAVPGAALRCDGMPEQACVCLETGTVLVTLPDASYRMNPGDSLFLQPFIPFTAVFQGERDIQCIVSLSGNELPTVTVERSIP